VFTFVGGDMAGLSMGLAAAIRAETNQKKARIRYE
jgi:hypothetical protein